jgi:hypothetical protein
MKKKLISGSSDSNLADRAGYDNDVSTESESSVRDDEENEEEDRQDLFQGQKKPN